MAKKNTYDAGSIAILEGLEAVRKRPGMYIGSVSTKGLNHLIYEIVDNAVDEHLAGYCNEIHVTLEKDGSATIADNGRGVPVDLHATGVSAARVVYTTLHAGGKFDDSADAKIVSNQLLQVIRDVPKAVLQDYTTAIATQKGYLGQQQIFFSSIAVILLIISLFHIVNSMSHTILTRRREYGIIRAIGITDGGFYKMILQTGILYGLLADVFIYLIYNRVLRRVMNYYLAHVLQFLHYTTNIPNLVLNGIMVLNVVIAVVAVMFPAWKMGKENIISEIRR